KYFPFDPAGTLPAAPGEEPKSGEQPKDRPKSPPLERPPPGPGERPPGPGGEGKKPPPMPPPGGAEGQPEDIQAVRLVRFIDVDVQIGHTYAYSIEAWLANPYYGLPKEVDAANWATLKLLSPANTHVPRPVPAITLTPPVTIPGEYFYYAVD